MRYLIVILFIPFFSFADRLDVLLYKKFLNLIDEVQMASNASHACANFIMGVNAGLRSKEDYSLHNSKRYKNWSEEEYEFHNKILHFVKANDYKQASYYAKERFEINCGYKKDLSQTYNFF